jgi:hypothetical protein
MPVARLLGIDTAAKLERLTSEGVIGRPLPALRSLGDLVSEQRR